MVMNEAASAPVVSATSRETPTPLEVWSGDEAGAGHAVIEGVVPAAHLLEAKHELAELLLRASKGVDVALGGGEWGAAVALRAQAEFDRLVVRRVHLELICVGGRAEAGDVCHVPRVHVGPALSRGLFRRGEPSPRSQARSARQGRAARRGG